jgi:hypothetical protein
MKHKLVLNNDCGGVKPEEAGHTRKGYSQAALLRSQAMIRSVLIEYEANVQTKSV